MKKYSSSISYGIRNSLIAVALFTMASSAWAAGYTVQSLKSPGPSSRMSANGAVAGFYEAKCTTFSTQPKRTVCYNAPWYFDGQRITKLGSSFNTNTTAYASDINDSLQMVGSETQHPNWIYSNGALSYLAPNVSARAINNAGVIAGSIPNSSNVPRAMTMQNGVATEVFFNAPYLDSPTTPTAAADINNSGMIAGTYTDSTGVSQAYIYANGVVTYVPNLGGQCNISRISEVNATSGQVWVLGACDSRPFIYERTSGTMTELKDFSGGTSFGLYVYAVNSSGIAVGSASSKAVMWSAGSTLPTDLTPIFAANVSVYAISRALDIDETGTILTFLSDLGVSDDYLLHPVP